MNHHFVHFFKRWALGVLVLVTVLIAFYFIAAQITSGGNELSKRFLNHLQASETAAAYALTCDDYRRSVTQTAFSDGVMHGNGRITGNEKEIGGGASFGSKEKQRRTSDYLIENAGGKTYVRIMTEKQGDEWCVAWFDVQENPFPIAKNE